ncbi:MULTISPECIES: hypothetical protein [Priestia]|uniref:hypothetical protein n=1 Tax=Priestia TaxID=2800373 RepID=UPI00203AE454|nr:MULTISPECIES: hypothetical protein [Priestia]MCM3770250.1 hypothetical protein [Priestia aryabhattai]MDY0940623.1 hypothetical protein [Priestia megaterium]
MLLAVEWRARRRTLREKWNRGDPQERKRREGSPAARGGKRSLARKSAAGQCKSFSV